MNWSDIRILLAHELRGALRERNILLYTILVPALLYPLLVWMTMTITSFLIGQSEKTPVRVALVGVPARHALLETRLRKNPLLQVSVLADRAQAQELIRAEQLEAALVFATEKVLLFFDGSRSAALQARERLLQSTDTYRNLRLEELGLSKGLTLRQMQLFFLGQKDLATPQDVGRFLLGILLPFTLIVILSLGGMYPAIDATAGERERGTWETSLTLATERINVVIAKYLYVASMAMAAGLLNLTAMTLSLRSIVAPMQAGLAESMSMAMTPKSFLIVFAGTALLSLLMAAAMMLVASFARTFREGQSLVTPLFLVMLLPVSFVMDRSLEFDINTALIPVVNVALLWREAIRGNFSPHLASITAVSGFLCIGLCLMIAHFILSSEEAALQGPRAFWNRKSS